MQIALTPWEIVLAAQAGIMRQVENCKLNRQHKYGANASEASDWQWHIEGALGEFALAKALQLHWNGKGRLRALDVGGVLDVRTATRPDSHLILHPDDPDDREFWLLTGRNGQYVVRGWIMGRDGKRQEFWRDPVGGRPAFFVPQGALLLPPGLACATTA